MSATPLALRRLCDGLVEAVRNVIVSGRARMGDRFASAPAFVAA